MRYKWLVAATLVFAFAVCLRTFFISVYLVPSISMRPAIEPNDFIVCTKVNRQKSHNFSNNEVVVFSSRNALRAESTTTPSEKAVVKRILGLPGDTVSIFNGFIRTNGVALAADGVQDNAVVEGLVEGNFRVFPHDTAVFRWTIRNFGPLWIPAKGVSVPLTRKNIVLYKELMLNETKGLSIGANTVVSVGDSLITEYTFKEDYCFVLGDNLFLSNDSRYWGPLPLGAITGRAVAAISLWPPSIRVLP